MPELVPPVSTAVKAVAPPPTYRPVVLVGKAQKNAMGPRMEARQLHRDTWTYDMDPFLYFDDFTMAGKTFAPHPHAGFSPITYVFEDSAGAIWNRDTLESAKALRAGELLWTEAGRGMEHEENPVDPGPPVHGVQIWVNLSRANRWAPARTWHRLASQIPEATTADGARVRVVAGTALDRTGLIDPLTRVSILDVHVPKSTRFELEVPDGQNAFALVIAGSGQVGPPDAMAPLERQGAVGFGTAGGRVHAIAGAEGLQLLLCAGVPHREPLVQHGPFVMSTREEIDEAIRRYRSGQMGRLGPA